MSTRPRIPFALSIPRTLWSIRVIIIIVGGIVYNMQVSLLLKKNDLKVMLQYLSEEYNLYFEKI